MTSAFPFDSGRLRAYLQERLPGADGALHIERIAGGQSNPTYRLGFAAGGRFVLRKQPEGPLLPSAHAIDREYRVLRALAGSRVPVPDALLYCAEREPIGTPFYVMQFVEGRVFHDAALPGLTPAERAALYDSMNDTLARLHAIDWQAAGLADFGRPGNYFERQIARWTKQYRSAGTPPLPEIEKLIAWLPAHIPPGEETAIAHGDFRLGNLMIHPREPRVVAVLDWELATLGHPLADLGYNCMAWHFGAEQQGLAGREAAAPGLPGVDDYAAAYCRRSGRSDGLRPFHLAFSFFRVAVIMAGIARRAAQGNAAADNAADMGRQSARFAAIGCTIAGI